MCLSIGWAMSRTLGWERIITIDGQQKDFYIRQLWDAKGSAEVETMNPADLATYGTICGWTLQGPMPAPGIRSRSARISVRATASIERWPCSRRAMPTRTSATTRPSSKPSAPAKIKTETGV